MKEVIGATLAGFAVGAFFAFLKFPVPAPHSLAGLMGIVGIYFGYLFIVNYF